MPISFMLRCYDTFYFISVLLLLAAALVLVGVLPHARPLLQGVKVLTGAAVMDGLQVLEVFHHEATLLILIVHLLGTQILM